MDIAAVPSERPPEQDAFEYATNYGDYVECFLVDCNVHYNAVIERDIRDS